ncbi:HsdM family class I SAM-dependent methyltransferase [Staphylococcus aureus]
MAVVLPDGVLFRGAAEGVIRRYLIEEKNYLEAVIGLPANIFYGTSIPTCILVFKTSPPTRRQRIIYHHPMILKKEKIKII